MSTEHTIICGGIGAANRDLGEGMLPLNLWPGPGRQVNVELKIEKLQERLRRTVPPQFDDLLEIAAYGQRQLFLLSATTIIPQWA